MAGPAAPSRSRAAWLRFLTFLAATAPTPALAGAWVAPKGGQEIWTVSVGSDEAGFAGEASLYSEAPASLTDSIVVTQWFEIAPSESMDGWRGETTAAVKHALYRGDAGALAVQGGVLWRPVSPEGCGEGGVEGRVLGGLSLGRDGHGFVNVETAARLQEGGCESYRLDLTAGYRPNPDWLAMAQLFVDQERDRDTEIQAQMTFVRFMDDGRGVQFGVRTRVDGDSNEAALVVGFWGRPSGR